MKRIIITGASDGVGKELAKLMLCTLELPKNIEVTDISINRKK